MRAPCFSRRSAVPLAVLAAGALASAGCAARAPAVPWTGSTAERAALEDTIKRLSRETGAAFDAADCERLDLAAIAGRFVFLAQGRVLELEGPEQMMELCRRIKRDRLSAHDEIQDQKVELLSRDAAYIVQRSVYTIRMRDGTSIVRPQVVTGIWVRRSEGWRLLHLHESWRPEERSTLPPGR